MEKSKRFWTFKTYLKNHFGKKEKILASILLVSLSLLLGGYLTILKSTTFYRQGKKEAIAIAEKKGGIQEIQSYYYFNRDETYFTIKGKNKKGEVTYVVITQKGDTLEVIPEKEGISENEALKKGLAEKNVKEINKISLGKYQDKLVWELTARSTSKNQLVYYYLDFTTGEIVEKITNI